ncbi:hypothetical protein CLU79DRAFT_750963 [Phycomyces nitens]|nr:hypothetical protein CLU79DRAFT_750963 [Phycomyces nitens]
MPAVLNSPQNRQKNKPIKWANQRVRTAKQPRVHKRTVSSASSWSNHSRTSTGSSFSSVASVDHTPKDTKPVSEIDRLVTELAYAYDSVATITVHFDSLRHAYACSKSEIDRSTKATRLCDMEKELLTAYDDLGLQVIHLERKIVKLETRLTTLRLKESEEALPSPVKQESPMEPDMLFDSPSSLSMEVKVEDDEDEEMLRSWVSKPQQPIGSPVLYEDNPYLLMNEQYMVSRMEGCMTPEYAYQHQDGMTFYDAPCYAISGQESISILPYAPLYYESTLASPTSPTFPMTVGYPTWTSSPRAGLT